MVISIKDHSLKYTSYIMSCLSKYGSRGKNEFISLCFVNSIYRIFACPCEPMVALSVKLAQQEMSGFDSSSDEENEAYDTSPFQVDWLDLSCTGCAGELGISALPGCRFRDTWRNLDTDIASLKSYNIKEVFVLCTRGELGKYRVPWLLHELTGVDFNVHHYPFPDGTTPPMNKLVKMLDEMKSALLDGHKVLVHCYGGLGRSGLVASCLLMYMTSFMDAETAIHKIRQLRGPGAIQSVKQYNFVQDFHDALAKYEQSSPSASRSVSR